MKRLLLTFATVTSLVAVAAGSALGSGQSQITIRHQMRGCHSWSYNGGGFQAALVVRLHRGSTLTVKNVDVMPHTLIQTAGPKAVFQGKALMNKIGAQFAVRFPSAGTYAFKTRAGEDYKSMAHMKTIGEDNQLTLKVIVS